MTGGAGAVGADRPVQVSAARPVVALDRDPCPGDVAAVRGLCAVLRDAAEACDTGAVTAAGWAPAAWRDQVAHATAEHVGRVVTGALALRRSLDRAADALDRWAAALADLQAEADALDREAQELRRRRAELDVTPRELVLDPMSGLDSRRAAQQQLLDSDLARVQARADQLHLRWVSVSRSHAVDLDGAALPAGPLGSLGGARREAVLDDVTYGVRLAAPVLAVQADLTGVAGTAATAAAAVPPLAPVAAPLAAALGGVELVQRTALAVGAGGSVEPVLGAAAGALPGAGSAGDAVRAGSRTGGRAATRDLPLDPASEGVSLGTAMLLDARAAEHTGDRTTTIVASTVGAVDVTVHDVAEPWQTAHGVPLLDPADGFAGVAVITLPVTALRTPTAAVRRGPVAAPAPGAASAPGPAARSPRSDQRDDQDGVGGRGL
ncbi:hypothetical protein [Jannaschia sp. R86511]|uniref:hypothetical protein n=1 Tax=Jannaschia sp. R86511 TaxID=3093853 RepID=UPI0036D33AA8